MFLEILFEYIRQTFSTRVYLDCSSNLREDWLPRLFDRAKLFSIELGDLNCDIGEALNSLVVECHKILSQFSLHMSLYTCNFNSITVNPLHSSGVEIRFHYYFTLTIGRPISPIFDDALNSNIIARLNRSLMIDPNPHLRSSFFENRDEP